MKLPHHEQAVVAEAKIVKYLLNVSHVRGKDKATFFLSFGFSTDQWWVFAEALLEHAGQHEVAKTLETPEGTHYSIDGELRTPDGRNPRIRSIWVIDTNGQTPRLVTAHPLKKSKDVYE